MKSFLIITFFFILVTSVAQPLQWNKSKYFTVMNYNVENLFDTVANSKIDDFLPESAKNWNTEKYNKKLENIAQVIASIHAEELPEIVGMIELENIQVLKDLVKLPILKKANYIPLLIEGPDARGIDCGLIYRPDAFKYILHKAIPVYFNNSEERRTRDILYVKGLVKKDTVHIFVNHWSSRRGGQDDSEVKRVTCAEVLKVQVDSIVSLNKTSKIVIMGDFNDEPSNKSLHQALNAGLPNDTCLLTNILYEKHLQGLGSYYFKGKYNMLDNLIVTRSLYPQNKGFRLFTETGFIHTPEFLNYTQKNGDKAPNRTYGGDKYFGGYSDHYPVYAVFYEK
ncbi:MAG: endonuclease [Salinivirgaceae bacterium]